MKTLKNVLSALLMASAIAALSGSAFADAPPRPTAPGNGVKPAPTNCPQTYTGNGGGEAAPAAPAPSSQGSQAGNAGAGQQGQ